MKKKLIHVKPISIRLLLWAIVVFIIVDSLAKFGMYDLTGVVTPMLIPTVAAFFLLFEVGFMQIIKRKKKLDIMNTLTIVIAAIVLFTVMLSLLNIESIVLTTIQGVVGIALGIFAVIHIFRK